MNAHVPTDSLVIAGKRYSSPLLSGTSKFNDQEQTRLATDAAGAQIVTVAIGRTTIGQNPGEPNLHTAITGARNPLLMASAMRKAVEAGREALLAGRMPRKRYASASAPVDGLVGR